MKFYRNKVAKFQEQDCALSLRQAIEEFYEINKQSFQKPDPKSASKWTELLVHHDVGHVVFGVNISILDESAGDYWTLFATDMKFQEYLEYLKTPEAKKLIQEIGVFNIFRSLIYSPALALKIYFRSRKMSKKWEMRGYDKYLDIPLSEVREIFGLKILEY